MLKCCCFSLVTILAGFFDKTATTYQTVFSLDTDIFSFYISTCFLIQMLKGFFFFFYICLSLHASHSSLWQNCNNIPHNFLSTSLHFASIFWLMFLSNGLFFLLLNLAYFLFIAVTSLQPPTTTVSSWHIVPAYWFELALSVTLLLFHSPIRACFFFFFSVRKGQSYSPLQYFGKLSNHT